MSVIPVKLAGDAARELMARAAIDTPSDYREGVRRPRDREQNKPARLVLTEMDANWDIAIPALANREINLRLRDVYRELPGYAMGRLGEASVLDEVV